MYLIDIPEQAGGPNLIPGSDPSVTRPGPARLLFGSGGSGLVSRALGYIAIPTLAYNVLI